MGLAAWATTEHADQFTPEHKRTCVDRECDCLFDKPRDRDMLTLSRAANASETADTLRYDIRLMRSFK